MKYDSCMVIPALSSCSFWAAYATCSVLSAKVLCGCPIIASMNDEFLDALSLRAVFSLLKIKRFD